MQTVVTSLKKKFKNPLHFAHPFSFSFQIRIGKKTSLFWSSDPSGWLQAEQGNFTGFLINIQPLSHASLGHLVVNVYRLVQDVPKIPLTLRLMTKNSPLNFVMGKLQPASWGQCTGRWMQKENETYHFTCDVSCTFCTVCVYVCVNNIPSMSLEY